MDVPTNWKSINSVCYERNSAIQKFTDKWNKLGPTTQKTVVKFAAVAASVGPVLMGLEKFLPE